VFSSLAKPPLKIITNPLIR